MKRILINATQPEEIRVAMVDGQRLYDLDIEHPFRAQKKANIYKGVITRVEPSLEAAFVNYGAQRHGFLSFREVAPEYYHPDAKYNGRPAVKDVLREGMEVLVQVDKEERGNKGAALTTYLSLAGRYLVLMPNNPKAGGVSRRIEGEDRQQIKQTLNELDVPDSMGVIVRTAGIDRDAEELAWDLDYLKTLWGAIQQAYSQHKGPTLLYQESNVIIRALRDYFRRDIGEIVIDDEKVHKQARDFMQAVMPHNLRKLKHYTDGTPLFSRFQVENQIETAYQRTVALPSGGAIVIDHTEALVSIDINSARATKGQDIEETALNTNLEAADEIARQLRLRDLGGLIVIDFIDMLPSKHQREVEKRLRDAMKLDRARVQVGRISRFGLLEMSRQRLRPSLGESSQIVCPRCTGHGHIRSTDSLALSILRLMEEEAMKEMTGKVIAQLPVAVATFLLNEKRQAVVDIQKRRNIDLTIIPNPYLETPHYDITRVRSDGMEEMEGQHSYQHIPEPPPLEDTTKQETLPAQLPVEAAVTNVMPSKPAPQAVRDTTQTPAPAEQAAVTPVTPPVKGPGLMRRIFNSLFGSSESVDKAAAKVEIKEEPVKDDGKKAKQPESGNRRERDRNERSDRNNRQQERKPSDNRTDSGRHGRNGNNEETSAPAEAQEPRQRRDNDQRNRNRDNERNGNEQRNRGERDNERGNEQRNRGERDNERGNEQRNRNRDNERNGNEQRNRNNRERDNERNGNEQRNRNRNHEQRPPEAAVTENTDVQTPLEITLAVPRDTAGTETPEHSSRRNRRDNYRQERQERTPRPQTVADNNEKEPAAAGNAENTPEVAKRPGFAFSAESPSDDRVDADETSFSDADSEDNAADDAERSPSDQQRAPRDRRGRTRRSRGSQDRSRPPRQAAPLEPLSVDVMEPIVIDLMPERPARQNRDRNTQKPDSISFTAEEARPPKAAEPRQDDTPKPEKAEKPVVVEVRPAEPVAVKPVVVIETRPEPAPFVPTVTAEPIAKPATPPVSTQEAAPTEPPPPKKRPSWMHTDPE
ncbi:MAG: Rne/Rng family ribonuclease [Candidatus Thiothrix moscowensis]|nr:Rne/Rng family ribonuclease [Candidatus Thiothrix moscowensis]